MHLSTPQGHDGALRHSGEVNQIKLVSEHSVHVSFLGIVQVGAFTETSGLSTGTAFNQVCNCTIRLPPPLFSNASFQLLSLCYKLAALLWKKRKKKSEQISIVWRSILSTAQECCHHEHTYSLSQANEQQKQDSRGNVRGKMKYFTEVLILFFCDLIHSIKKLVLLPV